MIGTAAFLAPANAVADPAQPNTPTDTVASVTAKLKQIQQQTETLNEQLNLVIADVAAQQKTADAAKVTAAQAQKRYQTARTELTHALTAQYEGGSGFSQTGALLTSTSGTNYATRLATLNMLSAHRSDVLSAVTDAKATADSTQTTADELLVAVTTKRDALTKQQTQLQADQDKYELLLDTLNAEQRATVVNAGTVAPSAPAVVATVNVPAPSNAAAIAVAYAEKQVGKAYVFAASGPDAFDCSGLTAAAYAQAGIQLPHNAAAQYGYGTHVDVSQLKPGDLIFLYQPIGHVEIYIGNNIAVSAADEELGVRLVNISQDMGDWAGATRLT